MDQDKFFKLQMQMRHNNEDYKNFLDDMDSWSQQMKANESNNSAVQIKDELPEIRNSKVTKPIKQEKIKAYDYKSWDKFDVDKALEECDKPVKKVDDITLSNQYKDCGNDFFKKGNYVAAVEQYNQAIKLNVASDILFSNRAMAHMKLGNWIDAELDCSSAITLNSANVKALYRRSKCRTELDRRPEAMEDLRAVLVLEPFNKAARTDLRALDTRGLIEPLDRPLPDRVSTRPMVRIDIVDVNPSRSFESIEVVNDQKTSKSLERDDNFKESLPKIANGDTQHGLKQSNDVNQSDAKSTHIESSNITAAIPFRHPRTALQLIKQLHEYRSNPLQLATYVVSLRHEGLASLIGYSLDWQLLIDLINGFSLGLTHKLIGQKHFINALNNLFDVSRFESQWMMLSDVDKTHLRCALALLDEADMSQLRFSP